MKSPYEDIINLPHHVSRTHPRMSAVDRAAQFSPFAALTGYEAAVKETARLTEQRFDLDETAKVVLDEKLRIVQDQIDHHPEISITYFAPDEKKVGGAYLTTNACVKKINTYERTILLMDGTKIPVDDIYEMESERFNVIHQD